jgi:hypothetical protein
MKKLLVITPHLSTGGAPQVTANKVKLMKQDFEIMVVEHAFVAWTFVVQRNRIIETVGEANFKSLGDNKLQELQDIMNQFKPDVISMEEFPEMFMDKEMSDWLYRPEREYTIIETTHDSSFNPARKTHMPDKFVFVSPFNALKYNHLDIPYEVIEYPVDKKTQNKAQCRAKLGLEPDYKHIVIIGLFTPRKNQKYAFELCEQTADYKIKYHFLGNQAGNFENYWKPLMDWKKDNQKLEHCVIWGERSDTEDFLNAADLFLFSSKGDRGNKELNPIVIKEALEYEQLPKLMYNLDVYLNRYDIENNMHYLTGDLKQDAQKVIELTNPKSVVNKDELVILGTYPNLTSRVELTENTILSLKGLGRKIMLLSHYPVDEKIQRMVDYYIFDAYNPLCHHSYYTRFYRNTNEFNVEVNINGLKYSNQSLTVLTNMFNGAKAAKNLGYKSFFYTTYDVVLDEDDMPIVDESFEMVTNKGFNAYLGTLNTPFGKGIQTNGMTYNTDFFLNTFDDVRTSDEYNKACELANCHNFLEDYMVKKLEGKEMVQLINNNEETLLVNSGLGVASNSEYFSILPIEKEPNKYMFYFFTYNIDDRRVAVRMEEDGAEFYNGGFQISKSREFMKEIEYSGKPINITLEFFDGERLYKRENYSLNSHNINTYNNTGKFKRFKRPKVKLVHIQTTLNDEREQRSRESLQKVKEYGIEYILHTNEPFKSLPPSHNSIRPDCVSMELFDEATVQKLGTALTPPHYGCFDAFKTAILTEFEDCDFLIVCEGDCLIETSTEDFCNAVYDAADVVNDYNIGFFSFGDTKTLEHGWPQSKMVQDINDKYFVTNHIIGIQSIMFPKFAKAWLKEQLRTHNWDAADIYFNTIFKKSSYRMGIVKNRFTTQADGYSLIDKQEKKFI